MPPYPPPPPPPRLVELAPARPDRDAIERRADQLARAVSSADTRAVRCAFVAGAGWAAFLLAVVAWMAGASELPTARGSVVLVALFGGMMVAGSVLPLLTARTDALWATRALVRLCRAPSASAEDA